MDTWDEAAVACFTGGVAWRRLDARGTLPLRGSLRLHPLKQVVLI